MKESNVYLEDCMIGMARYPDKYFDLAIVDPPYGIGASEMTMGTGKNKSYSKGKNWDSKTPLLQFFIELFRISKNQIIWGGNYFTDKIPISRGWIYWDKLLNKNVSFADGELAWTSFDKVLKTAKVQYSGFLGADKQRIHPTQKPVALYKWLLHNYAKQGDKILDTHLGSGSSRIAAYDMGFDFTAFELDKEYFEAQEKGLINLNHNLNYFKTMKQTPKEKAKELFDHYHILIQGIGGELGNEILVTILAEQCALFFAMQMQQEKWDEKKYKAHSYWEEVEVEIVNIGMYAM